MLVLFLVIAISFFFHVFTFVVIHLKCLNISDKGNNLGTIIEQTISHISQSGWAQVIAALLLVIRSYTWSGSFGFF